ncbi:DUF3000 family protein [Bifidobacterium scaligerum]|uniref:DUF3000 domain-containing protein n=1 Tax=Bifidobacterium scaligerum TaxID=2052656 RepID=A0A2M9HQL1_9BIFI|nr:DUF3000 family protein [Bifidobacterium scaligerum]PJM79107.1 DUF3000 domain-containing protein [Bifidobacterium scaligerum]
MAEIFAFPAGAAAMRSGDGAGKPQHLVRPHGVPDVMWSAVESVRVMPHRDGVIYREIPVPATLADFGIGVEFEVTSCAMTDAARDIGADFRGQCNVYPAAGWLMLLYARKPREEWDSCWRCVAFAKLPLDVVENDALTPSMIWESMRDFIIGRAEPGTLAGTVTVTSNTAFGNLGGEPHAGCEIRASWTPLDGTGAGATMDAGTQVNSWAAFIQSTVRPQEEHDVE